MPVGTIPSPRLRDDLDDELEPENADPRFQRGFGSLTLEAGDFSDYEYHDDARAFAGTPDSGANQRRRRGRGSGAAFAGTPEFEYKTLDDGNAFRLVEVQPGTGSNTIECALSLEDSKNPQRAYYCLSYCWQTIQRDFCILLNGCRFPVTSNLLAAMQALRRPRMSLLIWVRELVGSLDYNSLTRLLRV